MCVVVWHSAWTLNRDFKPQLWEGLQSSTPEKPPLFCASELFSFTFSLISPSKRIGLSGFVLFVWHLCSFKQLLFVIFLQLSLRLSCAINRDYLLPKETKQEVNRFVLTVLPGYFTLLSYASLLRHFVFFIMESKSEGRRGHAGEVMSQIAMNFQICIFVQRDPPLLLISPSPTLFAFFLPLCRMYSQWIPRHLQAKLFLWWN